MCIKTVEPLLGAIMPNFCHKHGTTSKFNAPAGVVAVMYFLDLYEIINYVNINKTECLVLQMFYSNFFSFQNGKRKPEVMTTLE